MGVGSDVYILKEKDLTSLPYPLFIQGMGTWVGGEGSGGKGLSGPLPLWPHLPVCHKDEDSRLRLPSGTLFGTSVGTKTRVLLDSS